MTQMLSRLQESFGVELSFKDIFDAPTVAALAHLIESSEKEPAAAPLGCPMRRQMNQQLPVIPATKNPPPQQARSNRI